MRNYYIDGYNLTIKDVAAAVKGELGTICIAAEAEERCRRSRDQIRKWLEKDAPVVYGVNTGLGNLKDTVLSPEDHLRWNRTIPYPHAVGMGGVINPDITRASLLIRANVLCRGYSAVRPELIKRMLDIFNAGISPVVLELGSTGLSDLGPLAQSAMVVAGLNEAEAFYKGERRKAKDCFREAGLEPEFQLECKEVLAQMNGSTMTQAIAIFACDYMQRLLDIEKQIDAAADIYDNYRVDSREKVYAAIEHSLGFVLEVVDFENNVSCDNPLLFEVDNGEYEPVMGCNCSNTQVGFVMDLLNILISEKANFICEMISRWGNKGYGFEKLRLQGASMVKEIRAHCLPASADSIPTKGNQEDHVEFSYGAARKAMKAVKLYNGLLLSLVEILMGTEEYKVNESIYCGLHDVKEKIESMSMDLKLEHD